MWIQVAGWPRGSVSTRCNDLAESPNRLTADCLYPVHRVDKPL